MISVRLMVQHFGNPWEISMQSIQQMVVVRKLYKPDKNTLNTVLRYPFKRMINRLKVNSVL